MEIFQGGIMAKKISVKNNIGEETMVCADEKMLKTIFRNLFSNAVKFINSLGNIQIDCEKTVTGMMLSVSDNGVGIPEDEIQRIWDIGLPRKQPANNMEQRSGYGLVICKELVEKHGGSIWAESKPGQGSVFRFTLPDQQDC